MGKMTLPEEKSQTCSSDRQGTGSDR